MDFLPPPEYWPCFSVVLNFFKFFGVLPLSIKLTQHPKRGIRTEFSLMGSTMSVVLAVLTLFHAVWGPQMHANLDKNMANGTSQKSPPPSPPPPPPRQNAKMESPHMKINAFIQTLYPWLGSMTAIMARLLGLFTMIKSLPVLLNTICRADHFLPLPSRYFLTNFKGLTGLAAAGFVLHVPVIVAHGLRVSGYTNAKAKIWQTFSMMNVLTTFSVELQFVLLCWSIRRRFAYINNLLKTFISPEFRFDEKNQHVNFEIFRRWKKLFKFRKRKIYSGDFKVKTKVFVTPFFHSKLSEVMQNVKNGPERSKLSVERPAELLKSIRRSHILLHDAMERLNDIYKFYLLLTILSCIVKFLVYCYYVIFGYLSAKTESSVKNGMPLIFIWCTYYCFRFLLLVNIAHCTVASSRQARSILSKIDWRDLEVLCRQEIKMFSHHLSRRNFEFSACGLFDLNTSLISTSFSTTVTYIVIMAQLH